MSQQPPIIVPEPEPIVSQQQAEEIIEKFEGATRALQGTRGWIISAIAVAMSLFALYCALATLPAQVVRGGHLLLGLVLIFLLYPARQNNSSWRARLGWSDVILALLSVAAIGYIFTDFEKFQYRSAIPFTQDIVFGALLIVLVLEGVRRSVGWHLSALVLVFLIYGLIGFKGMIQFDLPAPFGHRGYDIERIVSHMYMGLEGIFGTALDVSSSFIILFTIYGAFLDYSGAGKFFVDLSFALMGKRPTGAGRAVTFASFLLGGPSGSGVATTVTLGSIAYPMLRKAGYDKENAGGLLSAGGIGAVLSPPVLGAASFIIAEFLKISYLQVIAMSLVPTLLYYISIFLMIELDAHRFGFKQVQIEAVPIRELLTKYGYHLSSLVTIVIFMLGGFTAILAVFWSSVVALLLSVIRAETALLPRSLAIVMGVIAIGGVGAILIAPTIPGIDPNFKRIVSWENVGLATFAILILALVRAFLKRAPDDIGNRLWRALEAGAKQVLSVVATTAAAGIIIGIFTLTGLGLKLSGIIVDAAGSNLFLALVYTALAVWVLGLALPITASYIIAAVMAAPALIKLGVPDFAAHMFIFYYALLSEVSPPVGLSPFAAAAITGGNPYKTMMMAWKYTLPAFIVPFMFTLAPEGRGLLLQGDWGNILFATLSAIAGITALTSGVGGWLLRRATWFERIALVLAGILLVYPATNFDLIGLAIFASVVAYQVATRRA
jgi:TRAP transporter 4TM/12TM fusion protein